MSGSIFSDPSTMGLLGMSRGFAEAAMPSRMPVPFGAALGMGAAGMSQGAMAANQFALQQQQVEAAKIANQRNQALMNFFGMGGVGGPSASGGSGGVSSSGGGSEGGVPVSYNGNTYLLSPQELLQYGRIMAATGQDRAAASVFNMLGGMAGGPGYAMGANGTGFAVPGGGKDPNVIAQNSYAEESGKVPAQKTMSDYKTNNDIKKSYLEFQPNMPGGVSGTGAATTGSIPSVGGGGYTMGGGAPASQGAPSAGGAGMSTGEYAARIKLGENNTGNPAAANPNSSAVGDGQFIRDTWLQTYKQAFPDKAKGMSDDQILALRSDPTLSGQMTVALARQNAPILQQNGLPVNATTLALAHRFGPAGAKAVLTAPMNMPIEKVVSPEVMAANPDLRGQTAGRVVGNMFMRFGMAPVNFGGATWTAQTAANGPAPGFDANGDPLPQGTQVASNGPVSVPSQPQQPQSSPQTQQIAPGVTQTRLPNGNVQTTNTRAQMDQQFQHDYKQLDESSDDLQHAQTAQTSLLHQQHILTLLERSGKGQPGAGGEARTEMANYVETYFPKKAADWIEKNLSLPDAQLAQQFQKLSTQSATEQERNNLGARGGYQATQIFLKANPGMNMQGEANRQILNVKMIAQQSEIDYLHGLQSFVNQHQQDYINNKSNYVPATEYDRQWQAQNNPKVYAAAMAAINGEPFAKWATGLSADEGRRVAQIIYRVDPTASILGGNGKPWPVTSFLPKQQAAQ